MSMLDRGRRLGGRLSPPLVAMLAAPLLLAACGGDDGGGSTVDGGSVVAVPDADVGADAAGNEAASADDGLAAPDSAGNGPTDLFDRDFRLVCSGHGVPHGTPYDPAGSDISPVLAIEVNGSMVLRRGMDMPDTWTRRWLTEAPLALAEVQLVACIERVDASAVDECTGYEIDGQEVDNVVVLHDVTYEVVLREATTGDEVAMTTIEVPGTRCPSFVSFTEGESRRDWFPFDEPALTDFVADHVLA